MTWKVGQNCSQQKVCTDCKEFATVNATPKSCKCCVVSLSDCRNAFALITKRIGDKEKMYAFCIIEHFADTDKEDFLTCLSKAICSNMCRTDYVSVVSACRFVDFSLNRCSQSCFS